jgi:hypothetical protein
VGYRRFTNERLLLQGHFPSIRLPGVILVEAMAQTGGRACPRWTFARKPLLFASVDKVKFRRQVRQATSALRGPEPPRLSQDGQAIGQGLRGDELAAEAEWMVLAAPKEAAK